MHFDVESHRIFETITGSHLFGTDMPGSDWDYRGVVVPPRKVVNSLFQKFEQREQKDPDRVLYDVRKFMKLAADCNPNIVSLLFVPEKYWLYGSDEWKYIVENRDLFISRKARHTFSGYAYSQLKRMRAHERWIANPPAKPSPETFGLTHEMMLGKDEVGAIDWLTDSGMLLNKEIVKLMSRVKGYRQALREYKNYVEWREGRNSSRAELEATAGYDTKHAYHLVRLVRMGRELLTTGDMTVADRPDKYELKAIRKGEWTYKDVLKYAESIDDTMDEAMKGSPLPRQPDRDRIDRLCMQIMDQYWRANGEE